MALQNLSAALSFLWRNLDHTQARSIVLHVALGDQLLLCDRSRKDLRHGRCFEVVIVLEELLVGDACLGEVHNGRPGAARAHLCVKRRIGQIDVYLVAALDSAHRQLFHSFKVERLALEELDLRDDHVGLKRSVLARLHGNVLAFANNFDIALVHVEKLEADPICDLLWIVYHNYLVRVVLVDPFVHALLPLRRCSRSLCPGCGLGWSSFCWSCNFLLFLWCRSGGWSGCTAATTLGLRCMECCGASTILSALPVADIFPTLANECNECGHPGSVCLKPGLFGIVSLLADSISVEKDLRLSFCKIVTEQIVAWCRVPEEKLESISQDFHDIHWRFAVFLAGRFHCFHHLYNRRSSRNKSNVSWFTEACHSGEKSALELH